MRNTIPRDRLQAVADLAPMPEGRFDSKPDRNGSRRLLIEDYLRDKGVVFRVDDRPDGKGRTRYILDCCPFNPDHKGKDAAVFQDGDGKLGFNCFHDSCSGNGWKELRDRLGEPNPEHYDPPKTDWHKRQDQDEELSDEPPPQPIPINELVAVYPELRRPIVDGLLRCGETMGIHAKSKVGKSWFAYSLALSVASRSFFLGRYQCQQGKVLYVDNELHPENLAHRIPRVAKAMGIHGTGWEENLAVCPLRGRLRNIHQLRSFFESVEATLIVLDALYRVLPPGISENDNAAMAEVFNVIDAYANMTGAAIAFVHHASKGSQTDKDVVDVGSGAGSIARAVDTHLVLRPHEERDHVVLDAAIRSFAPIDPVVLKWEFPVWQTVEDMDPAALKGRKTAGEQRQDERDREGRRVIADILRKWDRDADGAATPNAITEAGPYGRDKTRNLLGKMLHDEEVTREPVMVRNNKSYDYFLAD